MLKFDIERISLIDINELIDKGYRFTLATKDSGEELDDLEEYLSDTKVVSEGYLYQRKSLL